MEKLRRRQASCLVVHCFELAEVVKISLILLLPCSVLDCVLVSLFTCVCMSACMCVYLSLMKRLACRAAPYCLQTHAEPGPALAGACLACLLLSISRCDLLRPSSIYMWTRTHTQISTNTYIQINIKLFRLTVKPSVCTLFERYACVCVCSSGFCHSRSLLSHRPHTSHASPSLSDRVALQEVCINRGVTLYGRILKYSYTCV